ncbi:hydrolase 76 protein [Oleoguttula sp. CCFEE 5521]
MSPSKRIGIAQLASLLLFGSTLAIQVDVSSIQSITDASKLVAASVVNRYRNSSTIPGLFDQPYYFWEGGLAWDSLVYYWAQTGDATYNELVAEAMRFQLGDNLDYMPPNQTKSEGNDDQSYWALAAMTAAEYGFPLAPVDGQAISWLQIAENVFNEQASRWDNGTCGGGLRWQIFSFNNGYNYKNSLSNGNFFQLAARLAHFTGNQTYSDWAALTLKWSVDVGLAFSPDENNSTLRYVTVYDGTDISTGCTQFNRIQWMAALGTYLAGSAFGFNTSSTRLYASGSGFVATANTTFLDSTSTIYEPACAPQDNCNTDQLAFKAVLARALGQTAYFAPFSPSLGNATAITSLIQHSAQGAASQCRMDNETAWCGTSWGSGIYDGNEGLGQDLGALNILLAALPQKDIGTGETASNATSSGSANGTATGSSGGASGTATPLPANDASGVQASGFALLAALSFLVAFGL